MPNPPYYYSSSDPYDELFQKMTHHLRAKKIDDRLVGILQQVFEQELSQGNIVLSRSDRVRLYRDVSKTILTDALGRIEDTK